MYGYHHHCHHYYCYFFFNLETGFYYVGLVGREIIMNIRLTMNLWLSFVFASHMLEFR